MDRRAELSEFLRSRRARLTPADVGIVSHGHRRVPGLRREELAQLAGVGVDHYVRLEQGRNPHVSPAVLDAIARALRLDADETRYLHNLARPATASPVRVAQAAADSAAARLSVSGVRRSTQLILDSFDGPAYAVGPRGEILAWNDLARSVFADYPAIPAERRNAGILVFLDDDFRALFGESLARKASDTVAFLRMNAGRMPQDPALIELIGKLSVQSEEFRTLWARQDVHDKSHGTYRLRHPLVGDLELTYEALGVSHATADQMIVAYTAEPGSPSADALQLIGSWSSTRDDI